MIVISAKQMAMLGRPRALAFEDRLAADLRRKGYPTVRWMNDDALQRCVRAGIARAHGHGLSTFSASAGFVVLMFGIHPEFDSSAPVGRILSSRVGSPEDRVALLLGLISVRMWERLQHDDVEQAWQRVLRAHRFSGGD